MRRCSPIVDCVSVERFLPHADPAPWAGNTRVASGSASSFSCRDRYSRRASSSGATPDPLRRSGRPTSPMNMVSPVSTPYGTASSGRSRTTTLIDSGVCPGVASTWSVTSPRRSCSPSREGLDREVDVGTLAVRDRRSCLGCELEVPTEEIGVDVGLDHALDAQAVGVGVVEVDLHVAPRIDDDGPARALVTDEVRRLGQAVQVVLHEVHSVPAQLPLDRLHLAVQRVGDTRAMVDLDHDAHSR